MKAIIDPFRIKMVERSGSLLATSAMSSDFWAVMMRGDKSIEQSPRFLQLFTAEFEQV